MSGRSRCGAACGDAEDAPDGTKLAFGRVRPAPGARAARGEGGKWEEGGGREAADAVAAPMGRLLQGRAWLLKVLPVLQRRGQ